MKAILLVLVAIACLSTVVAAGPNAGGTLILVHGGLVYCSDDEGTYCGSNPDAACDGVTSVDGAHIDPIVLNVMAAFPSDASPRVSGVAFGVAIR